MPGCCFPLPHLFLLKARYGCQAVFSQINDRLSASGGSCTTKCQLSQTCNVTWPGARNSPVPVPVPARESRVFIASRHCSLASPSFITRPNC